MVRFEKNKNHTFTFVDMFAGIGGFHVALKDLGGRCVAACEIDEKARVTYLANHSVSNIFFYKDIKNIDVKCFPNHDLLCAGFPCQPFSISGKQRGLKDERSEVIDALFKIINYKKPRMVILENVKHIRHIDSGNVFKYIIICLEKVGYKVSFKLLNAKDYGVAQNRERWIFVGVLGNKEYRFNINKNKPIFIKDIIEKNGKFEYLNEPYTLIKKPKKQNSGLIFCGYRNKNIRKNGVKNGTEHLSRVHKQPNRIYSCEGVHPTIPSQEASGRFWISLNNGKVRKLTVKECFRLMGFNDDFVKPVSIGNLYKQIGNSVCVPLIKSVSKSLLTYMGYLDA